MTNWSVVPDDTIPYLVQVKRVGSIAAPCPRPAICTTRTMYSLLVPSDDEDYTFPFQAHAPFLTVDLSRFLPNKSPLATFDLRVLTRLSPRGGTLPGGGTPRSGTPREGTPRSGTPREGTPSRRAAQALTHAFPPPVVDTPTVSRAPPSAVRRARSRSRSRLHNTESETFSDGNICEQILFRRTDHPLESAHRVHFSDPVSDSEAVSSGSDAIPDSDATVKPKRKNSRAGSTSVRGFTPRVDGSGHCKKPENYIPGRGNFNINALLDRFSVTNGKVIREGSKTIIGMYLDHALAYASQPTGACNSVATLVRGSVFTCSLIR